MAASIRKKIMKKYNKPHRCTVCAKLGHRKDNCPKQAKKKKVMKKRKSKLDKNTLYTNGKHPDKIILKTLKQESFVVLAKMSEVQAKQKLIEMGLMHAKPPRSCCCWDCNKVMAICGETFVCRNLDCGSRNSTVISALLWSPLYHWARGGHTNFKQLLLAMYVVGLKIPTDTAQHLIGASYDTTESLIKMIKVALAYSELHIGRDLAFPTGILEFDGTKTNISRSQKKKNVHCGRFIIVYHRESGQYALEPLPDKEVLKGAPPPPESFDEVKLLMTKKVKDKHIVCTDSAQAYKKVIRTILKDVPHATVVHKKHDFSKVVKFPVKYLSEKMKKIAAKLPTSSSRTMRVKAGDQGAEGTFGVIKRNLTRMNLKSSTSSASLNFLVASWLHKQVGMKAVVKGMVFYRNSVYQKISPQKAFKNTDWLKAME